jgi:hypothetical protein
VLPYSEDIVEYSGSETISFVFEANHLGDLDACISSTTPDILKGVGGDYCYYKYPWADQYE